MKYRKSLTSILSVKEAEKSTKWCQLIW